MELGERFWSKVLKSSGCWEWQAHTDGDGYGIYYVDEKNRRAHRLVYAATFCAPGDAMVCHRCDNPRCVRPDHLFMGDATTNNRDRASKGRGATGDRHWTRRHPNKVARGDAWREANAARRTARGERVNTARLSEADVRAIRRNADGLTQPALADRYGVTLGNIQAIVYRKTWKHVE